MQHVPESTCTRSLWDNPINKVTSARKDSPLSRTASAHASKYTSSGTTTTQPHATSDHCHATPQPSSRQPPRTGNELHPTSLRVKVASLGVICGQSQGYAERWGAGVQLIVSGTGSGSWYRTIAPWMLSAFEALRRRPPRREIRSEQRSGMTPGAWFWDWSGTRPEVGMPS